MPIRISSRGCRRSIGIFGLSIATFQKENGRSFRPATKYGQHDNGGARSKYFNHSGGLSASQSAGRFCSAGRQRPSQLLDKFPDVNDDDDNDDEQLHSESVLPM